MAHTFSLHDDIFIGLFGIMSKNKHKLQPNPFCILLWVISFADCRWNMFSVVLVSAFFVCLFASLLVKLHAVT